MRAVAIAEDRGLRAVRMDRLITTIAPLDQAPRWFAGLSGGATEQVKVLLRP